MISKLVKLADQLDAKGKADLADLVDHTIKCIVAGKEDQEPTDEEVEQLWEDENNAKDADPELKPGEKECDECEKLLPLSVLHSPAGFYLGYFCYKCGPKGKHSYKFFKTIKEAEEELKRVLK